MQNNELLELLLTTYVLASNLTFIYKIYWLMHYMLPKPYPAMARS